MPQPKQPRGIQLGPSRGKTQFRIRQRLVRDCYAPLIRGKALGAVKLDLLLRCIALNPEDLGNRQQPGIVRWSWSFEDLHDLVKDEPSLKPGAERDEQRTRHLKRKWVADQLSRLQALNLVRVTPRPGRRPEIVVLRDNGRGGSFDNPAETYATTSDLEERDPYFTISGGLLESGEIKAWNAAELAAYFAALSAEFHHPLGRSPKSSPGAGFWYRPLAWFKNPKWGPAGRVLMPFSVSQIEKGLVGLEARDLIAIRRAVLQDPRDTKRHFNQLRNIYRNRFNIHDPDYRLGSRTATPSAPPTVADTLINGLAAEQQRQRAGARA